MSDVEDHGDTGYEHDDGNDAPPKRKLYDDEDSEEEEEEEEEQQEGGKKKRSKHRKRDPLSRFLDIEAEVSDEEEEEDDDEELVNDGFIAEEGGVEGEAGGRHHARLDKRREMESGGEKSAEDLAKEFRERYNTRKLERFTGDMNEIPQRLLMPSVHDASLWQVRVKAGRERDIVFSLMRKSLDLEYTSRPLTILSAFQRDSLPGMIYVEARSSALVSAACTGLVGVYLSRGITLVPIDEMALLLTIKKKEEKVAEGTWVRLKRGKYAGDLAQVVDITENGDEVGLRFVPRIDLNPRDDGDGSKKRKKGASATNPGSSSSRPPQRLFNYEEVVKLYGRNAVSKRGGGSLYVFLGDTYKDGFIEKDVKLNSIILEDINPTLDEITMFSRTLNPDGTSNGGALEDNMVDLSIIAESSRKAALAVLQPGDHVEVFEGEQAGVHGVVEEISGDVLTITASGVDIEGQKIDLPARSVRKRFKPGDHVKVMQGKNAGETGLVVAVSDASANSGSDNSAGGGVVTFLSDMSMQEVSVFSKDLREAAEVGNGTNVVGEYELHDLVWLDLQTVGVIYKTERDSFRVLDQNGQSRLVHPHQITIRRDARDSNKSIATDSEGHEIRIGDGMKEVDGESRKGRVLHIHQSHFAFLHNREIAENGGVFVTRARGLVSVAPKGSLAKLAPGTDLTKMNPAAAGGAQGPGAAGGMVGSGAMGRGPRDRLIGVNVVVIKGPHKGYIGIVRDTNGNIARVELNTGNKVVSIDKSKIHRRLPNGKNEPIEGPGATTPNPYASGGAGGRTPGWGGAGGRTPGWGGAGGGGRTPNPYAMGAGDGGFGGKTPAWNVGSKTPNPYAADGGRTPAWNAGNKTPNPYGDGGRTPGWGAGGGNKTPNPYAANSTSNTSSGGWGGSTPGRSLMGTWDSGTTGGEGWGGATPGRSLMGTWDSGVTGGDGWGKGGSDRNAPTPASWGGASPNRGAWNAPTPASAATPAAFAPTPGLPYGGAPTPYSVPTGGFAAPTPGLMPTPGMSIYDTGGYGGLDMRNNYQPPSDWLLDPSFAAYLTSIRVVIKDTRQDNYLDGKYELLEAQVLAASRAAANYEQTALVKVKVQGNEEDRSILTKYLFPVPPSHQDQAAVILTGPRKGDKVKLRQRPDTDADSLTELVVVQTVIEKGRAEDGSANGEEGTGPFWECQKDWMGALR
ncbi:hypothetical protein BDP27DRAFT_1310713 [Rhodocollybia butyracea]|uniref:Transcription elongation factor SPT5 n=1 Tax=Rhodocollybia butyracea TaxID=206335 RepID=A0A9P5QB60_9AGAR|nr:hypothetical protein BDP27DRAFT_1310713 [Rhodocollybia butyracea]